jgi:hypothetical protein
MKKIMLGLALLGAAASPGFAQTTPAPGGNPPTTIPPAATAPSTSGTTTNRGDNTGASSSSTPAVQTDHTRQSANAPVPGANSFTEGQARSRIEGAGFSNVTGLHKDDQGIWRGQAMRNGKQTTVALDYQGNVTDH